MHFFYWDPDLEGQLLLRFPWLPYWMAANLKLRDQVWKAVRAAIPSETQVKDMTPEVWARLDRVLIDTVIAAYPRIHGLDKVLEAVAAVEMEQGDPSRTLWAGSGSKVQLPRERVAE